MFTTKLADQKAIEGHGFDAADYPEGTVFHLVEYSDRHGLSGIVTEYEGVFSAICCNEDEIFDTLDAAAIWLGARLN